MERHRGLRDIYIIGAQSTGKTTLIEAFADHFSGGDNFSQRNEKCVSRANIIKEVTRIVIKQHSFTNEDIKTSPGRFLAVQQLILEAQMRAESAGSEHGAWFISDRSGADAIMHAHKYAGESAESDLLRLDEWLELRERIGKSEVIVCGAGADSLTDDGVWLMPESWEDRIKFNNSSAAA